MRSKLLIGLDVGTSGAKCIAVDETGAVVASSTQDYPLSTPRPGWAEQNPEDWYDGVARGLREILSSPAVDAAAIAGLSFSGQMHGLVALDRDRRVIRPAMLWCDQRTQKQCDWITERAGLSLALGAFVAGMLISETQYKHQVEEDIKPFRDVLLGLFFISIGMLLNLELVLANWWLVLAMLAIPVMLGASLLKLMDFGLHLTGTEWAVLLSGMVSAFLVSVVVIKFLLGYIRKHDFKVFGWYRIVLGVVVLLYFFLLK